MTYRELLIGCGRARDKRVLAPGTTLEWRHLTTLDSNPNVKPTVIADLEGGLPLPADHFDEVHAYEVLEHLGTQGNVAEFFFHFSEIYRVLKPSGYLCATCPSRYSPWLWGDPGHRRAILPESLLFLSQPNYAQCNAERPSMMSDYRYCYRADFNIVRSEDDKRFHRFILQAIKPARLTDARA